MKQLLALFVLFLCSLSGFAQDVIVKNDGSTVLCRIVEVGSSEVIYKKWAELEGVSNTMNRSDIMAINYENGHKEAFSAVPQVTKRNVDMKIAASEYKTAKTLKKVGWIGGGVILGAVIAAELITMESLNYDEAILFTLEGAIVSTVWTSAFLLLSKHYEKEAMRLQKLSLWQEEIRLSNGSSVFAGVDILKDNRTGSNMVGLGLRYNF